MLGIRDGVESTIYRYAHAFDENDMDAFADCFTEDGVIKRAGGDVVGREEIRRIFAERRNGYDERGEQPRHIVTNILIDQRSETEATVTSYLMLTVTASGTEIRVSGRYVDEMVLDGDRWRFASRETAVDSR